MRPSSSSRPRYHRNQWLPPRVKGWNELVPGDTTNQWFYYNAQYGRAYAMTGGPQEVVHFKDVSVYFCRDLFWCVPYDATEHNIGDWRDDVPRAERAAYQSQGDAGQWQDWHLLSFAYDRDSNSSFVGIGHNGQTLCKQRADQHWVPEILPDIYHATVHTTDPRSGCLSGDLGLLMALLALSVSPATLRSAVESCIRSNGWLPFGGVRRSGCKCLGLAPPKSQSNNVLGIDQRGVVVRIWIPRNVPNGREVMRSYEFAQYGHIYR